MQGVWVNAVVGPQAWGAGCQTWAGGLQRLQLKTVLITLLCETGSWRCVCVCARVRGAVWCVVSGLRGVLIGPSIAWNRTNKCVRFFSWRGCRGAGAWLFSRFSRQSENALDLGVEMPFASIVSLWEMNARDAW